MNNRLNDIADKLIDRIVKTAGFSNDIGLFEGKMGIVILLFHSSRHFHSETHEKVAEFLIDDILEDVNKLIKSNESFWALDYLSKSKFIELEADFFKDVDVFLFRDVDDISKLSPMSYPSLGNYILSRHKESDNPAFWNTQIQKYLRNMVNIILTRGGIYKKNMNLLGPFCYALYKTKESGIDFECSKKDLKAVCSYFDDVSIDMPDIDKCHAWFQYYRRFNKLEFSYDQSNISSIKAVNLIYLNRLLYPGFIIPSVNQMSEALANIIEDKNIMRDLICLISYQNIGLSGYASGFTWAILSYLKDSN